MKFEHEGKIYATVDCNHCYTSANPNAQCAFYWRDGGIYDSCEFPDQDILQATCSRDRRAEGINVVWMKLKPWMTRDHCHVCEHRQSQHDMNCLECCPAPIERRQP